MGNTGKIAELFFSAHTLFLDDKENLAGNLKKSATPFITTHNQVCLKLSSGLYTKISLPVSLGSSEDAESCQVTCAPVDSSCKGSLGPQGTDPLQRCTWESTFPQSRVANDLTFSIWLHTVKTTTTSKDNNNTSIILDA